MSGARPVVHLELHTSDLPAAREFYSELCGWRPELVATGAGAYLGFDLGRRLGGGIVECRSQRPLWLPYVEVDDIHLATERGRLAGARVMLEPREGPAGWRSVMSTGAGGEVALWQPKR